MNYWSTFLVYLFANFTYLIAQEQAPRDTGINLVPNPSFEQLNFYKTDKAIEPFMAFRKQMVGWNSPTETTPDLVRYINSDNYETARTGDNMIGILTHNPNSKKSETWREYIQVRLDLELDFDEQYIVEFWVMRHPQSSIASNNIGALLSRIPFSTYDVQPITHLDLAVNETEIINPGQSQWQKISAVFTAKGDERFLLIGNFFNNEDTNFEKVKNTAEPEWTNPYYLIDDVSVRQLEEPGLDKLEVKKGDVVKLNKIYFESNRWNLLQDSYKQLDQLANLMHKHPKMRIAINGYTDSKGTASYNQKLSEHRCESVFNHLLASNINPRRMEYQGHGELYPVDTNNTEEGRQNNRRVEFVILTVDPAAEAKAAAEKATAEITEAQE
jgi:outer membrane protein OmpA-like peptidoglycan-associated protein